MALRATRQTARMVHSLLDLERLEDGRAVIQRKRTAMRDVLTNSIDIVHPAAIEGGQTLVVEIADAIPMVEIDADMIQRVIVNLAENAIKHTPRNGEITLRTSISDEGLYISVSDTGPGVPRQHLKEIFDKYYRVRHANAGSGTGLGLAFCRLAVEAHGGRIWVESDPGSGATFAFILPIPKH